MYRQYVFTFTGVMAHDDTHTVWATTLADTNNAVTRPAALQSCAAYACPNMFVHVPQWPYSSICGECNQLVDMYKCIPSGDHVLRRRTADLLSMGCGTHDDSARHLDDV